MPVFTRDSDSVLYIHIPKSGGSSIEHEASKNGWEESFSVRGKSLNEIKHYRSSPQHFHERLLSEIFDFNEFDLVFTVVRNPFQRLKSEYYWQKAQGITSKAPTVWIARVIEEYSANKYIYDNHIRPQIEFIPKSSNSKVFKLEDGAMEDVNSIFFRGNRRGALSDFLDSFRNKNIAKKSKKEVEVEREFNANKEIIFEFYKADFETFGYDL